MVSVRGWRRLVKWLPVSLRVLQPLVPRVYPLLPSLPFLTLLLNPYLNPYLNPLSETFLRPLRPEFFYHLRCEQYHCDSHLRRDCYYQGRTYGCAGYVAQRKHPVVRPPSP